MNFQKKILLASALAVFASTSATANDAGWYLGGNLGMAKTAIDDEAIARAQLDAGLTTTTITDDDHGFGYKVFGGYQFNRYFALESGFYDFGKFRFDAETSPPGSLHGELNLKGLMFDVVGIVPMTERWSAFGRVGMNYALVDTRFRATGSASAPADNSERGLHPKIGVGLQYDFTDALGMRLEVERYRFDDSVGNDGDVDLLSAGLVYRFGRNASAPAPVVLAPKQVPAPVAAAPAPIPPQTVRYCSVLDIAFEIKKSAIQIEESERLAVVGTFLAKYPETTAIIQGHTDDVGSDEFNQTLSQARADSVLAYLVDKLHIAPSRLKAVGYGESHPIASNSTSDGKRTNRRINAVISCARDIGGLTVTPARLTLALEMDFDPLRAEIEPQFRDELAQVAAFLKANPTVSATVEGHADKSVGLGSREVTLAPETAMALSKRRASNVVNYLVDHHGIERSRLTAAGFGQTRRITYGETLAEQHDNRRVNIIFTYPKK